MTQAYQAFLIREKRILEAGNKCCNNSSYKNIEHLNTIPKRYFDKTFGNYVTETDSQKIAACQVSSAVHTNRPIFLFGKIGNGKTHLAVAAYVNRVVKKFVETDWAYDYSENYPSDLANFYTFTGLYRHYRCSIVDRDISETKFVNALFGCQTLVIDEFGISSDTGSKERFIQELFDERYSRDLQTIVVSNDDVSIFKQSVGKRIIDRFVEQGAKIVNFDMPSYRHFLAENAIS